MSTSPIILIILAAVFALCYAAVPRRAELACGDRGHLAQVEKPPANGWFRIATYNIHGGKGTDGARDLDRTARVIDGAQIVALQEVRASRFANQCARIGQALQLEALFLPTVRRWLGDYRGNGLLSAYPIISWRSFPLPNVGGRRYRIYTVAEIAVGGSVLSVLLTHLHTRAGRERQLDAVLAHFARLPTPCVLLGDLNSDQQDPAFADLAHDVVDAIADMVDAEDDTRVDWILTRGLDVRAGGSQGTGASDHPFYWAEVKVP